VNLRNDPSSLLLEKPCAHVLRQRGKGQEGNLPHSRLHPTGIANPNTTQAISPRIGHWENFRRARICVKRPPYASIRVIANVSILPASTAGVLHSPFLHMAMEFRTHIVHWATYHWQRQSSKHHGEILSCHYLYDLSTQECLTLAFTWPLFLLLIKPMWRAWTPMLGVCRVRLASAQTLS